MNAPLRQTANRRKYRSPCIVRPRSIWAAPGIRESATIRIRNGRDYSKEASGIKHQASRGIQKRDSSGGEPKLDKPV
jgi:hypothetical protein